jgi:3-keto-5-aminohexanoate cleavage enzyme
MQKLIITAAVVGSRPSKEQNPAVPYTPKEIADEAIRAWRAGAAIAHIHVREPQTGAPSSELVLFKEVLDRIRAESDMLVNLTTSGLNITGSPDEIADARLEPVSLNSEICSLDIGSMNFFDQAFINPPQFGETAAKRMLAARVKPEIEVFELGHVEQAKHMIEQNLIASPPYFQLCMGVRWGIPAHPENLLAMKKALPGGAVWSVLGVGRHQLPMIKLAMQLGGHIRVGFEDNLFIKKGLLANSNAQFVEQAVEIGASLARDIASPTEARQILHLD